MFISSAHVLHPGGALQLRTETDLNYIPEHSEGEVTEFNYNRVHRATAHVTMKTATPAPTAHSQMGATLAGVATHADTTATPVARWRDN